MPEEGRSEINDSSSEDEVVKGDEKGQAVEKKGTGNTENGGTGIDWQEWVVG